MTKITTVIERRVTKRTTAPRLLEHRRKSEFVPRFAGAEAQLLADAASLEPLRLTIMTLGRNFCGWEEVKLVKGGGGGYGQ